MNTNKCLSTAVAGALFFGMITHSPAALVLNEYFNYGGTNVDGNSGSVPFNNSTGQPWISSSSNVDYITGGNNNASFAGSGYLLTPSNTGTGSMQVAPVAGNTRGSQLALSSAQSGEVWVSMMVRATSGFDTNGDFVSLSLNSAGYSNSNPNGYGFGIGYNGTLNTSVTNATGSGLATSAADGLASGALSGNYYLIVARLNVVSGNDSIDIWTFANNAIVPTSVAGLGTVTLSYSSADMWGNSFSNIYVGARGAIGSIDAIRISNASGDNGLTEVLTAVPEPTTWALLVGSLALLFVGYVRKNTLGRI